MPTINSDGKSYRFIPGKGGSLSAPSVTANNPIYSSRPPVAKTIGPCKNCGDAITSSDGKCDTCGSYSNALTKARRSPAVGSVRG